MEEKKKVYVKELVSVRENALRDQSPVFILPLKCAHNLQYEKYENNFFNKMQTPSVRVNVGDMYHIINKLIKIKSIWPKLNQIKIYCQKSK